MSTTAVAARKVLQTSLEKSLCDLNWVGFDLDHTLIRYDNSNLLPLIFTTLQNILMPINVVKSY
jgi:hypothetical protein